MSRPARNHRHGDGDDGPGRQWPPGRAGGGRQRSRSRAGAGRRRRRSPDPARQRDWRHVGAKAGALLGLGLLLLGPAAVVVGCQTLSQHQPTPSARLGSAIHDGSTTFVVHDLRCGRDLRGGGDLDRDPTHGRFCVVELTVRNDGAEAARVRDIHQRLYGAAGARYQPDETVTQRANGGIRLFGTLKPGEDATGRIVFDVPETAVITHVEVRADEYSRGVAVQVPAR